MNNIENRIDVAARVTDGNAESVVFGELIENYPQGLFIKPASVYHAGDLGRLIPTQSIIFADFYKKNLNIPPASNLKINMRLNAGFIFNGAVVISLTEYGVYIKNEPLADEIESVKFIPYSAMAYCDFTKIDDSAFIDLNSIDDPDEPATEQELETVA
jgi:hypothetical protein